MELRFATPSTQREYEQWAGIMERVSGEVFGLDELRHFFDSDTDSAWLLALDGDEAVGCGVGRPSSIQDSLYAMVRVLPERRGQGAGGQIYAALSDHARRHGCDSLWGRVLEDDADARRWARNRGFREAGREYEVVLDLREADSAAAPPPGVELVSLAERPDLVEAVHQVDCEVSADVPRPEGDDFEPMSLERWRGLYLEGPGAAPEALIVALAGDEVAGYTGLRRRGATSPVADNLLTAVRLPFRRRGIAVALKQEQIARAGEAGIEQLFTTNDETNAGMRAVNAALGYRPAPVQIVVTGPLSSRRVT